MDGVSLPPYMDVQVQAEPWMALACRRELHWKIWRMQVDLLLF